MKYIRKAHLADAGRIAEIFVFNYRLNFYPIFRNDDFYFDKLTVSSESHNFEKLMPDIHVFDDGVVKGFIQVKDREVKKLFVEPTFHGNGIGSKLLEFAVTHLNADCLWALEKNTRSISFYKRHGFKLTGDKKYEDGTTEYLVCMKR